MAIWMRYEQSGMHTSLPLPIRGGALWHEGATLQAPGLRPPPFAAPLHATKVKTNPQPATELTATSL
jgi:hypothetical protein